MADKFTGSELISHYDKLMAYAIKRTRNREDALDVVQTTYMRAIRYNHSFYTRNWSLGAWLMTILKNVLKDYYEKLDHSPQLDDKPIDEFDEIPIMDSYKLGKVFKDERLEEAFKKLTPIQRETVFATYFLDIPDIELRQLLGVGKQTLISRRKKGMDALRRAMAV